MFLEIFILLNHLYKLSIIEFLEVYNLKKNKNIAFVPFMQKTY